MADIGGWKEHTPGHGSKLDCGLKRGGRNLGEVRESVDWMDVMIINEHRIQLQPQERAQLVKKLDRLSNLRSTGTTSEESNLNWPKSQNPILK